MTDEVVKTDAAEKRSVMLSVRLTSEDADSLRRDADALGLSVSEYLRQVLLTRHDAAPLALPKRSHSTTVVAGAVALRRRDARLVPATRGAFVSALIPG